MEFFRELKKNSPRCTFRDEDHTLETSNPKLEGKGRDVAPPLCEMWMDGEEFGHVGIYSIIDEFIYPVPVGTQVHTPNSG